MVIKASPARAMTFARLLRRSGNRVVDRGTNFGGVELLRGGYAKCIGDPGCLGPVLGRSAKI
jgi:hypothetical protein